MPDYAPDLAILEDGNYIKHCVRKIRGDKYDESALNRVPDGISCVEHYLNAARTQRDPKDGEIAHKSMYEFAYLDDEISKYPEKFIEAHLINVYPNRIKDLANTETIDAMRHFYNAHHDVIPNLRCETDKFYGERDEDGVSRLSCIEEIIDRDALASGTYPFTTADLVNSTCHLSLKSSKSEESDVNTRVTCLEKIIDQGLHCGSPGFKYKKYCYSNNILAEILRDDHLDTDKYDWAGEIIDVLLSTPEISSTNKDSYLDMAISRNSDSSIYDSNLNKINEKRAYNNSHRLTAVELITSLFLKNLDRESVVSLAAGQKMCDGVENPEPMNCIIKLVENLPSLSRSDPGYADRRHTRMTLLSAFGISELESILKLESRSKKYEELYDYYNIVVKKIHSTKTYSTEHVYESDKRLTGDTVIPYVISEENYSLTQKTSLLALIYSIFEYDSASSFLQEHSDAFAKAVATSGSGNKKQLEQIFIKVIGDGYRNHLKYDFQERIDYDEDCFKDPGIDKQIVTRVRRNGYDLYGDKEDPHGILGVYTISLNEHHSPEELEQHMKGVVDVYNKHIRPLFFDKRTGVPILTTTIPTPGGKGKSDRTEVKVYITLDTRSNDAMQAGDGIISIAYYSENRNIKEDRYMFCDILSKFPKEFKKLMRTKDIAGYNKIQNLTNAYRKKPLEHKQFTMTISNRNADILRASACQHWDEQSCLNIYDGCNRNAIESYAKFGTYIAYLTENNTNEVTWLARLFIHKCDDCLSIQDRGSHYSTKPHYWHILHDAVRVIFNQKNINENCQDQCTWSSFFWNKYNQRHGLSDDFDVDEDGGNGYLDYTDTARIQKINDAQTESILKRRCGECKAGEFVKLIEI